MNDVRHADMLEATRLTRAGQLTAATALLQRALRGGTALDTASAPAGEAAQAPAGRVPQIIDLTPDTIEPTDPEPSSRDGHSSGTGVGTPAAGLPRGTAQPRLPEALRGFLDRVQGGQLGSGIALGKAVSGAPARCRAGRRPVLGGLL